jgi:hypothetical protein
MANRVVFRSGGSRFLELTIEANGSIRIHGHDVGSDLEEIFGSSDYEWFKTIPLSNVGRFREVFEVPDGADLVAHLQRYFTDDDGHRFETLVRDHELAERFWSWP